MSSYNLIYLNILTNFISKFFFYHFFFYHLPTAWYGSGIDLKIVLEIRGTNRQIFRAYMHVVALLNERAKRALTSYLGIKRQHFRV